MSVRFGPGLEITSVSSNAQATSPAAMIENLPRNTVAEDVLLLLRRLKVGEGTNARAIQVTAEGGMAQAVIRFEDALFANAAIEALNGHRCHGGAIPLAARAFKPTLASEGTTQIDLSWCPPTKSAKLLFQLNSQAEAILALAEQGMGVEVRGRRIKCIRQQPRPSMPRPYSVSVVGLDVKTTEEDLRQQFGCDQVNMAGSKALVSSADAEAYIRSLFGHQPVKTFKLITAAYENKQRAIVKFETAEDARELYRKLQSTNHDTLGPTACSLDINLSFSATFRIPLDVFLAIRDEIYALVRSEKAREQEFGRKKSTAKGDDAPARLKVLDKTRPVLVHVDGSGRPAVVRNKAAIQKLLRGEILYDEEGMVLWDPALVSIEGRKLVREVKDQTGTYVRYDARNRCVTLFGSPDRRKLAKEMLAQEYVRLLDLQHEISLKGASKRQTQRGLAAVQEHLGMEKVIVDTPGQRLLVRCSPAEIQNVRSIFFNPARRPAGGKGKSSAAEAGDCLVCFTPAEDGIKMERCSHVYCKACARNYIKSTIDTRRFPVTCVGNGDDDCDAAVPIQLIEELLSQDDADRLFEHAFMTYIQSRPQEYHFCPTPDCATVFKITNDGKAITCSSCFCGICTTCKTEAHDGQSCEEYRFATNLELVDEKRLQEWKKGANVKNCPKCGTAIEKNGGCMHITCRCQAHICWKCLGVFPMGADVHNHLPHCKAPPDAPKPRPNRSEPHAPPLYVRPRYEEVPQRVAPNINAHPADPEPFVPPWVVSQPDFSRGDILQVEEERRPLLRQHGGGLLRQYGGTAEQEAHQQREAAERRQEEILRQSREEVVRQNREAAERREEVLRQRRETERRVEVLIRQRREAEERKQAELLRQRREAEERKQADLLRRHGAVGEYRQAEVLRQHREAEERRQAELLRQRREAEERRQAELLRRHREAEERRQAELLRQHREAEGFRQMEWQRLYREAEARRQRGTEARSSMCCFM